MSFYFDHNATSILDKEVLEILVKSIQEYQGNPSSVHAEGRKAKSAYLKAKDVFARIFKVQTKDVFFTSSATEAINWLLLHKSYKHIVSSDLEHAAIYQTLKQLEAKGTRVTFIHPGKKGYVSSEDLIAAIDEETDLIFLGSANSETGILQNTQPLSEIAKSRNIPFYVDAVAELGKASFVIDPNVTAYVISSHKIHGPKGIAALIFKQSHNLHPLFFGGHQENGKKAGTESVAHAIAFSLAFSKILHHEQELQKIKTLRDHFESLLKNELDLTVIGENQPRVNNTSNICFHGVGAETLLQLLDLNHIYASHGSACSSGALEPSRVLINMDLPVTDAKECIRFSFSKNNQLSEINQAVNLIINIIRELKVIINN